VQIRPDIVFYNEPIVAEGTSTILPRSGLYQFLLSETRSRMVTNARNLATLSKGVCFGRLESAARQERLRCAVQISVLDDALVILECSAKTALGPRVLVARFLRLLLSPLLGKQENTERAVMTQTKVHIQLQERHNFNVRTSGLP
jgi:hypothetical protein